MAHELETINGRTAFATARVPAWHQLGTVTTDCMTATEVISITLLVFSLPDKSVEAVSLLRDAGILWVS